MTDDTLVTIEVDGQELKAKPGAMIIEVTDEAGISIPRFCYHKKLSISANCRMCLVEVEQGGRPFPKPLPACATPVGEGMVVKTRSPKALAAQKGTMEFLLINHPLDCPICDQGGECELQDVAMGYGGDVSRFSEGKRVVMDEDFGPLIATDMTRCIHCTRCVRFGAEVAGIREMGATGRGEHMRIGVYVSKTVDHELSGNIIDLCPVGALTSKPFRFSARAWELTQSDGIASHDGVGANLHIHVRRGKVMRVHPRDNEAVNETWISDRDRFSYQGLYAADRLTSPMVKKNGQWKEADWDEALQLVAGKLKENAPATLISPRATLEEMYLAQKLTRGLGGKDIDSRLRQGAFNDAADPLYPGLGVSIADLEKADAILVIGANLRKDQPLLAHRVRKAAMAGAEVIFAGSYEQELTHPATQIVADPDTLLQELAGLAKGLGVRAAGAKGLVHKTKASEEQKALGQRLKDAEKFVLLLGNQALASPAATVFKGLAESIAEAAGGSFGYLPASANSSGAHLAGALPHVMPGAEAAADMGRNAGEILANGSTNVLMIGFEPDRDVCDPAAAVTGLAQSGFVAALSAWRSPALDAAADVLLPIGDFGETAGTLVNADGLWQSFQGVVAPAGDARPAWKVLRVLGNLTNLDGFDQVSAADVRDELAPLCEGKTQDSKSRDEMMSALPELPEEALCRLGDAPLYSVDGLVRRAPALQATADAPAFAVYLNGEEAGRLGLTEGDKVTVSQGEARAEAEVLIDRRVPAGCARIPSAVAGSETLGPAYGPVNLEKV